MIDQRKEPQTAEYEASEITRFFDIDLKFEDDKERVVKIIRRIQAEARNAALEEAAKLAQAKVGLGARSETYADGYKSACEAMAMAIRAMKKG